MSQRNTEFLHLKKEIKISAVAIVLGNNYIIYSDGYIEVLKS